MSENKPLSREERRERTNEFIERKAEKAKLRDSRVLTIQTEDAQIFVNILQQTDIALMRVRKQIGIDVDTDKAIKIIDDFKKLTLELDKFTEDLCDVVKFSYRQPSNIKKMEEKLDIDKKGAK